MACNVRGEYFRKLLAKLHRGAHLGWARVLEVDSRIKVDPGKFVKNDKLMPYLCSGSNFISNLVTNQIQKRRGEPGLFYFEYNLLPKLISNFYALHWPGISPLVQSTFMYSPSYFYYQDKNKILYGMISHIECNFVWFMPIIPLLISIQKK